MARYLQAIVFALFGVAAANCATFPHSVHLAEGFSCATCHAKATTSTNTQDDLLPPRAICESCHANGPGPKLPADIRLRTAAKPNISKFSHQQHLTLGNVAPVILEAIRTGSYLGRPGDEAALLGRAANACEGCHRGLHESEKVSEANMPKMADCLVCHKQIEPPFSCSTCHNDDAQLMPASHDGKWLDFHSSGKAKLDKESCAVCHGRKFTCRGCHVG